MSTDGQPKVSDFGISAFMDNTIAQVGRAEPGAEGGAGVRRASCGAACFRELSTQRQSLGPACKVTKSADPPGPHTLSCSATPSWAL